MEEGGNGGSRRRGRRGGRRDRSEKIENPVTDQASDAVPPVAADSGIEPAAVAQPNGDVQQITAIAAEQATTTHVEPAVSVETAVPAPIATPTNPEPVEAIAAETVLAPEPAVVDEVKPVTLTEEETSIAAPTVVAVEPEIVAPATIAATPVADLEKALETSGLVMVETSGDKVKAWQPEETPRTATPRRRRPTVVATQSEPLVMVETNK